MMSVSADRGTDSYVGSLCPYQEDVMAMVTDPVCGMKIDTDDAAATAEYEGKTYYFCSEACRDAFVADPAAYAD
jgi:Cu+-exporting ATPase